ncbi:MAG TPA: hypothetical protein VH110_01215 [Candidatus Acidoferrum sp.]|jgi:hypothetical protein|nr:hypothetical protein [Candidatus Acidoferrum sp.]
MRLLNSVPHLIFLLLIAAEVGKAQQEQHARELPDAPVAKADRAQQTPSNSIQTTFEILSRRSVFFPDLATSKGPLRVKQKFELSADESVAPSRFLSSGFGAGISQARNTLPDYGQEIGGYGKRFGALMATEASSSFFGTFVLSSALRDDPRYFVMLHGGPGRRAGYAVSRIFVTRTDAGTQAANWPRLIGPLLAESLANSYLPQNERTASKTLQRYGWRIGYNTASNVLKEYWPTIFRSLRLTKIAPGSRQDQSAPTPAASAAPRP